MKRNLAIATLIAMVGFPSVATTVAQACPDLDVGSLSASGANSWVAGAQAGYNWQRGSWVYGVETDISAIKFKSASQGALSQLDGNCLGPASASLMGGADWYGTTRARLGWTTGQLLFYGTGGLAYGRVKAGSTVTILGNTAGLEASSINTGWIAGGGVEYAYRPNIVLTLEYQYVDLGSVGISGTSAVPSSNVTINQTTGVRANFQVVMVGMNFLFGPAGNKADDIPVNRKPPRPYQPPLNPWEGLYVGGHAGGAWGTSANGTYSVE